MNFDHYRRLAFPLRPLPDEIFSSWLCRNAIENGVSFHTFLKHYLKKLTWNIDIDRIADRNYAELIAHITGVHFFQAYNTTLQRRLRRLKLVFRNKNNTSWITHITDFNNVTINHGLRFCPQCFSEDYQQYMRLEWRLAFVTFCANHKIFLHDRCYMCGSVQNLAKVSPNSRGIGYCVSCNSKLSEAPDKNYKVSESHILNQNLILSLINVNLVSLQNRFNLSTDLFFELLRDVTTMTCKAIEFDSMRKNMYSLIASERYKIDCDSNFMYLECYPSERIFVALCLAYLILKVSPCNYIFELVHSLTLNLPRNYPKTLFPCLYWCESKRQFPYNKKDCKNQLNHLLQIPAMSVLELKFNGIKGIKYKPLKTCQKAAT